MSPRSRSPSAAAAATAPRVLVALAATREELHRARRHLGYDRLVVLAPDGGGAAARLAQALEAEPGAEVEELPRHDLLACLERIEARLRALASERRPGRAPAEVRVVVDGGSVAMQGAALLACLGTGTEAWFLMHKPVRLPVLRAMPVERRFTEEQVAVLRALEGKRTPGEVARRAGLEDARAKGALLALRKLDAVRTDASGAELTRLGAYYRAAVVAGAGAREGAGSTGA